MLPAAPLTSHIFRLSHAACCITFRSRRLRRDAAQPQGRFSRLQGYRGLVMPGPCMPHGGRGRSGPLPFCTATLTLHQSLMMVRQGRF